MLWRPLERQISCRCARETRSRLHLLSLSALKGKDIFPSSWWWTSHQAIPIAAAETFARHSPDASLSCRGRIHPTSRLPNDTKRKERKDADTHHNERHCLPAETVLWRPHHQIYQCKQVSLKKLISKDFLTRLDGSFQNKRGFHEKESDRWSNQLEWLPVPRKVLDNYTTSTYRTVSLHRLYFFCD